jgi:hypothetical protein
MTMSHCHGSNFEVLICSVPKLMKPEMICAINDVSWIKQAGECSIPVPFMRTKRRGRVSEE